MLYLPLDERFTTRGLFLDEAKLTSYRILTPDESLLPHQKRLPEMKNLLEWTKTAAKSSDVGIISAEMLLYGGLIASRISSDSFDVVKKRLQILEDIRRANPNFRLFVSTTITRIPAYSSDEEEPDYYARYGREIFQYSFFTHRFETTKDSQDKITADDYRQRIPPEVLRDFLNRRVRNFEINKELIKLVARRVIERLVITLDDNSEYGFSKKEATELEKLALPYKDRIAIYPGADEAQLALLSKLATGKHPVSVYPVYRYPQSKNLIPAFEGAPLDESVKRQIEAAGGMVEKNLSKAESVLYVNNFVDKETFPPKDKTEFPVGVESLENLLKKAGINSIGNKILILADNRFYNGADAEFVASIFNSKINPSQIAYAGWNTSGNTLGSAISLGILRYRMKQHADNFTHHKKLLFIRFIEDWVYMTIGREQVRQNFRDENLTDMTDARIERKAEQDMQRFFNSEAVKINRFLQSDFTVERVYFPWHRPFEVGFDVSCRNCAKNKFE